MFAVAAVLGALINGAFVLVAWQPAAALVMRFATGLCLAGIYPLGMKLVISWTPRHTGAALAWLVDFLAGAAGTRYVGATPRAFWGAALGAVVGLFFGALFGWKAFVSEQIRLAIAGTASGLCKKNEPQKVASA